MGIIELTKDDPMVLRASALDTSALTEVGFIPGDEYGCKIYASRVRGRMNLIGLHSRSYGCPRTTQTDAVIIKAAPLRPLPLDKKYDDIIHIPLKSHWGGKFGA